MIIGIKGSTSFWISKGLLFMRVLMRKRYLEVLDLCSKTKPKSFIHLDGIGFGGGVRLSFLRLEWCYGPFLCNVAWYMCNKILEFHRVRTSGGWTLFLSCSRGLSILKQDRYISPQILQGVMVTFAKPRLVLKWKLRWTNIDEEEIKNPLQ